MGTTLNAQVTLEGQSVLRAKAHTHHEVQIDYIPPLGGDDGFMPLELLLVSLAGCSLHSLLFLLRKMGKTVEGLEVNAVGKRRDEHPTVFTEIELHYNLKGKGLDTASVEQALRMSEETYCPVWAMLKNGPALSSKYQIN